jgi:hypothetical protein
MAADQELENEPHLPDFHEIDLKPLFYTRAALLSLDSAKATNGALEVRLHYSPVDPVQARNTVTDDGTAWLIEQISTAFNDQIASL